uniref:RND efflux system, outer membrane lipoprotein, NodT family n=1 Tax=Caulobacter sp. (strain K31) TaxID=366602 RepID=B0T968_CAUSK
MTRHQPPAAAWTLIASGAVFLAGCSLSPVYQRPTTSLSPAFKEALDAPAAPQGWSPAAPSDQHERGPWWRVFNDEVLDALEARASGANQDVAAAAARVEQARGLQRAALSDLFPSVDVSLDGARRKDAPALQGLPQDTPSASRTLLRAQAGATYEADLFGRARAGLSAARDERQQSQALLADVQLAVQADVAQTYFLLRAYDAEIAVLTQTTSLRQEGLAYLSHRYEEGQISELDLARARTELASAKADTLSVRRLRASAEHGLAILLGQAPADLSLSPAPLVAIDVQPPAGLPSSLLERRPDIAAAERAMMAANARIGVARSAYFPTLSLTAEGGFASAELGDLFKHGAAGFIAGPILSLPLLDGGRRKAGVIRARGRYDETLALYRQQVLVALRETEDGLSDLRYLRDQTRAQAEAVSASRRGAQIARSQYREGSASYLDVIDAERTALQAQRGAIQLSGVQAVSTVNLIRALGGGWREASAPIRPGRQDANQPLRAAPLKRDQGSAP